MRYSSALGAKHKILQYLARSEIRDNRPLPPTRALVKQLGVSGVTLQKAIRMLQEEVILETKPRVGVFVKRKPANGSRHMQVALVHPLGKRYLEDDGPFPTQVVDALRAELERAGFSLHLCGLGDLDTIDVCDYLRRLNLAGLVLLEMSDASIVQRMRELWLPLVSMDYDASQLGVPSVSFDNAHGTFQATSFLISQGHRHIDLIRPRAPMGFRNNPFFDLVDNDRFQGYRLAMLSHGLPVRVERFDAHTGGHIWAKLQNLNETVPVTTAMVCTHDWVAASVAHRSRMQNIRIPEDISVIGFGNTGLEVSPGRRLTSVGVDYRAMGTEAARLLVNAMNGDDTVDCKLIPAELVLKESVASLRPQVVEEVSGVRC